MNFAHLTDWLLFLGHPQTDLRGKWHYILYAGFTVSTRILKLSVGINPNLIVSK